MAVNRVDINGATVIDLTGDSVTPETLLEGATAHNAAGDQIDGAVAVAPASTTTPKAPGTASAGSESAYARGDHVHPKQAVTKSDVGLGNVDNVRQYSASNPPPYPVTSVNGATGEVKSAFYVTVTKGEGYTATADKTAEEVYAAYEAGYAVYANLQGATLPLAGAVSNSGAVMLGFETILGSGPWDNTAYACVLYNEGVWLTWSGSLARLEDIPAHLPNRFPLEIKIGNTTKSYDGSMKITVEIPEGVPSVTTADNGKFLRVVNGAWAAVEIANANGGSF